MQNRFPRASWGHNFLYFSRHTPGILTDPCGLDTSTNCRLRISGINYDVEALFRNLESYDCSQHAFKQ